MRSSSSDFSQRQGIRLQASSAGAITYLFQKGSSAYPLANPTKAQGLRELNMVGVT